MLAVKKCCSTSKCSTSTGYYLLRCKDCGLGSSNVFPPLMTHPYVLPDNKQTHFRRYLNYYELQIGCYLVAILLNSAWVTSFYGIHGNFVKFARISWERGQSHETYDPVVRLMVQSWDSRYKIGLNNYLLTVPVFPYMITYFSKKYFDKFFLRKNVHTPLLYLSPIKWNVL